MPSKLSPRHIIQTARRQIPITARNALLRNGSSEALSCRQRAVFKWYSCGPTVYDDAHLGHARAYVSFDIIRRIVSSLSGVHIDYVLGVTDIDDKIVQRAAENNISPLSLATHFEERFFQDMSALHILPPTKILRVTEHILELQHFISGLIESNAAYVSSQGNVYFSVKCSGDRYGQLDPSRSLSKPESIHSNVKQAHADKLDPRDFALWKRTETQELHNGTWDSPWGKGRPGWHVECSAMAMNAMGSHLDLHTGGIDLRFPHHTNELATAEAKLCLHTLSADPEDTHQRWSHTWLHAGHLHLQGRKMSKSVKNFVTIREFLDRGGSADAFRTFCLLHRYSSPVEYSEDRLIDAQSFVSRIRGFLRRQNWQTVPKSHPVNARAASMHPKCERAKTLHQEIEVAEDEIEEALADDFNTPKAMSKVSKLITVANSTITSDGKWVSGAAALAYTSACRVVTSTLSILGISKQTLSESVGTSTESNYEGDVIDTFIKFRSNIRAAARRKDLGAIFELCDSVRNNAVKEFGIQITDKKDGSSTWTRTT